MSSTIKKTMTLYARLALYHIAQWIESRFQDRKTRKTIMKFLACHLTTATQLAKVQSFCIFGNTAGAPTVPQMERMLHVNRWPFYNHKF